MFVSSRSTMQHVTVFKSNYVFLEWIAHFFSNGCFFAPFPFPVCFLVPESYEKDDKASLSLTASSSFVSNLNPSLSKRALVSRACTMGLREHTGSEISGQHFFSRFVPEY